VAAQWHTKHLPPSVRAILEAPLKSLPRPTLFVTDLTRGAFQVGGILPHVGLSGMSQRCWEARHHERRAPCVLERP
jgi:hypothetical protein